MTQYEGKCFCGRVSFKLKNKPANQLVCYCVDCQHLNSGGRLCAAMFDKTAIEVVGQTTQYNYFGGSGQNISLHFCPTCGTRLFHFPEKYPKYVVVQINTIEKFIYLPTFENFPQSIAPWDKALTITKKRQN